MDSKIELKEPRRLCKELEEMLSEIPSQYSCTNSKVPEGRVWCDYYNQTFAGRCNQSCIGYENKYLTDRGT